MATLPAIAVVHESTYTRIGAADGLPYNNTQTIAVGCGKIWMGSDKGVVVRDLATSEWQYLYGPRWHPGRCGFLLNDGCCTKTMIDFVLKMMAFVWQRCSYHRRRPRAGNRPNIDRRRDDPRDRCRDISHLGG